MLRDGNLLCLSIKTMNANGADGKISLKMKLEIFNVTSLPSHFAADPGAVVCVLTLKMLLTGGGTLAGQPSSACRNK